MPRTARKKSNTNVYHVILRGINRQDIFFDETDKKCFLGILKKTKEKYMYELYAYVIMKNHIHLLINTKEGNISTIIQSIAVRYAKYFNERYKRVGYLFQNRFKSKTVETISYLKNVQRYIHYNPQKAGICSCQDYAWSSYQSYIKDQKELVDIEFILQVFDQNREIARKYFEIYHQFEMKDMKEYEMENEIREKIDDQKATQKIKEILKIENLQEIKEYSIQKRNKCIQKLKCEELNYAQIARILKLNRKIVERAMKK